MQDNEPVVPNIPKQIPWNKGKLIGAKPPLRPKHIWSIRAKLQVEDMSVTWPCSTLPSTASCGAAMSLPSKSRMSRQAGARRSDDAAASR